MSQRWNELTPQQRVLAAKVDIMENADAARLSGYLVVGKVVMEPGLVTAGTNGVDILFDPAFVQKCDRKQLRWVCLHEALHIALKHCVYYKEVCAKYPDLSNIAMDHVVNLAIEAMDPKHLFIEHPAAPAVIHLNPQFKGLNFLEVLHLLVQDAKKKGSRPGDHPQGSFDKHQQSSITSAADIDALDKTLEDAKIRGEVLAREIAKRAGRGGNGAPIDLTVEERTTDWRTPLRRFLEAICEGDDYSRFCPPNKRLQPHGIVMPSHFSESIGEIVVACDTSGSMVSYYPVIFGEIARVAEQTQPAKITILWWDTQVRGTQVFTPGRYDQLRRVLKPKGGGGTSPGCINQHLQAYAGNFRNVRGVLILTDGFIDGSYHQLGKPVLWGVVENRSFRAPEGAVVHINL